MIIVDPLNNTVDKEEGRKTLTLLVYRCPRYRANKALYPDFPGVLLAAAGNAADAKALNSVLAQLTTLPQFVADSEGSDQRKVFFSVTGNWVELAETVLDILYVPPDDFSGGQSYIAITRGLPSPSYETHYILLDERRWR